MQTHFGVRCFRLSSTATVAALLLCLFPNRASAQISQQQINTYAQVTQQINLREQEANLTNSLPQTSTDEPTLLQSMQMRALGRLPSRFYLNAVNEFSDRLE